jgi:hypothetical protein
MLCFMNTAGRPAGAVLLGTRESCRHVRGALAVTVLDTWRIITPYAISMTIQKLCMLF